MKSSPPQYLYRDVLYHPPEADCLAEKILDTIRLLPDKHAKVDTSAKYLDSHWEGHQREKFASEADPHKRKFLEQLDYLKRQEKYFRSLEVSRREQYVNPEWEAYQRCKR